MKNVHYSCNYGNRRSDGGEVRVESDSGINQLQLKYLISVKTYNHMNTLLGLWRKPMQVWDPDVSIRGMLSPVCSPSLQPWTLLSLLLYILFTFGFIADLMASLCPVFSVNTFLHDLVSDIPLTSWLHHFSCPHAGMTPEFLRLTLICLAKSRAPFLIMDWGHLLRDILPHLSQIKCA